MSEGLMKMTVESRDATSVLYEHFEVLTTCFLELLYTQKLNIAQLITFFSGFPRIRFVVTNKKILWNRRSEQHITLKELGLLLTQRTYFQTSHLVNRTIDQMTLYCRVLLSRKFCFVFFDHRNLRTTGSPWRFRLCE